MGKRTTNRGVWQTFTKLNTNSLPLTAFTPDEVIPLLNAIRVFFTQIGMSKSSGDVFTEEDMVRMFTGNNRGLIVQILQSDPVPPYNLPTRVCKEMYDGVYTLVLQVEKRVPDNSLSAIRSISCAWILRQVFIRVPTSHCIYAPPRVGRGIKEVQQMACEQCASQPGAGVYLNCCYF